MAAADSIPQSTNYVPLLVATLPVILAPIVAWVLGRSRISREAATIDYLDKRLDFLERLSKLDTQLTEGPVRHGDRTLPDVSAPAAHFHSKRCRDGGSCASIALGSLFPHRARRVRAQAYFQRALLFLLCKHNAGHPDGIGEDFSLTWSWKTKRFPF